MGTNRLVSRSLPSSSSPIGLKEFVTALSSVLSTNIAHHGSLNKRVGLAISGGVDSMALALLCSRIRESSQNLVPGKNACEVFNSSWKYRFQAFVVDHGVRQGSHLEADAVSKVLEKRGIQTHVLKIPWNEHHQPAEMPNFESLARKYRFQVLGRACRDLDITSLLLAHHQDDQAETVMMRMIAGHRMRGLIGIRGDSEIPECYGIHGVHESGRLDNTISYFDHTGPQGVAQSVSAAPYFSSEERRSKGQLSIEAGGVRIYRPLLSFSKARLRATCEIENMEWFEDHTNKDPTLTTRNAVRHMYSTHAMPAALTKPVLLSLSQKFKDEAATQLVIMNSWLAQCVITQFETRTGMMSVRFNDTRALIGSSADAGSLSQIAAGLIRRIIMLVTPEEHVQISSLHGAVQRIFPEASLHSNHEIGPPGKFTVAGVQFDPFISQTGNTEKYEWLLSRQSYKSTSRPKKFLNVFAETLSSEAIWSPWTLFDGRFWIRLQNQHSSSIFLRPFCKDDLKEFMDGLPKSTRYRFRGELKRLAPGDIRWTLPAIVLQVAYGIERVLALPTMDVSLPNTAVVVKWEVRYKKVDLEGLPFARN